MRFFRQSLCFLFLLLAIISCSGGSSSKGKTTIRYMYWDVTYNDTFDALKKAFEEKYTNIQVIAEIVPFKQYFTKLQSAASSSDMADVFWMNFPNAPTYISANILEPLTFINDDPELKSYADNIPKPAHDIYFKNNNYYAIPKGMDSIVCFINTKIFKDANVAVPNNNWTLDDLVKVAQELQPKLPANSYVYGLELNEQNGYLPYVFGNGGYDIKDGTNIGWDNPKTIEAIELYTKIINEPWSRDPNSEIRVAEDYLAGRSAILQDLSTLLYSMQKNPELLSNTIILPLPVITEGNPSCLHSVGDAIFAKSKNKEAAIEFFKFMNSPEGLEIQAKTSIFFPLSEPYISVQTENLPVSKESISNIVYSCTNSFPYPSTLEFTRYFKDMDTAVKSIVQENKPASDTLKALSENVRGYIK